jgi:HEAT repeat protein
LAALNDSDTDVRVYAIQSLSSIRSKQAIEPCSALLSSGAPRLVMVNAIKFLAEMRDPKSVPALIEATRHEDAFVRHDAAWALGEIGDPRATAALEALLGDEVIPVQKNELGLTTHSSIYSIADQARRSLKKLSSGSSSTGSDSRLGCSVSVILIAGAIITLAVTR